MQSNTAITIKSTFKNDTRRFLLNSKAEMEELLNTIKKLYQLEQANPELISIYYFDEDEDKITITNTNELGTAIQTTLATETKILRLVIKVRKAKKMAKQEQMGEFSHPFKGKRFHGFFGRRFFFLPFAVRYLRPKLIELATLAQDPSVVEWFKESRFQISFALRELVENGKEKAEEFMKVVESLVSNVKFTDPESIKRIQDVAKYVVEKADELKEKVNENGTFGFGMHKGFGMRKFWKHHGCGMNKGFGMKKFWKHHGMKHHGFGMHKGCPMKKFWKHHGMFGMHHPMHHGMFGGMNQGFGMHHPMHHGFDMDFGAPFGMHHGFGHGIHCGMRRGMRKFWKHHGMKHHGFGMHKGCPMRKFWKHHGMFGMHHPMHHGMFGGMNHGFGMHHPMHHGFDMHHGMFGMNHPMFDMNMNQMSPFNYNQFDQYPSQFQQNPFVQEQEQEDEYQDEKPWKKFTKKGKKAKNDFGRRQGRRGRRGMGMEMQQFEDEMNENIPPQQEQEPKEKK